MNNAERQLLSRLNSNVDSFESYFEDESADAPVVTAQPSAGKLGKFKGNPTFSAQFDITVLLKYFTLTGGAYTAILPAALNAALKNQLPFYLFGNSDFQSGFANLRKAFPLSTWVHGRPQAWGKDSFTEYGFDATVTGTLQLGDLVIPFTSALPGAGTTTLALVIVRCTQVPYATLLNALSSDRFVLNRIRYVIPDTTLTAQYSNNIGIYKQSLFGKLDSDFVSPNSFKLPEQQQTGIIDIPLKKGITKEIAFATYVNYDCTTFTWSVFVWSVRKLGA
jgi:hypothetical protein